MGDAPETTDPRWLDPEEQQQWYAFAYTKAQQRQLGAVSQRILGALDAPCPTDWAPPGTAG
ncbi:hypothetical protein ACH4TS_01290 [Streptomyces albidoflavus]